MKYKALKYQVKIGDRWEMAKVAVVSSGGWLHYELRDGTIGLLRPSKYGAAWRQQQGKEMR